MMSVEEKALLFTSGQETLVGVLSQPAVPKETAIIIIVGGPQYRAGSHRQFVQLARRLATQGYPVLRFDYRGMGDASGAAGGFLTATPDIRAAINTLQQQLPIVQKIVLWGLCDAASAALLYTHVAADTRIKGLCLLNPWVRSDESLARTQVKHYYTQRLLQKTFWIKLLSGRVAFSALNSLVNSVRISMSATETASDGDLHFQQRMASAWIKFKGHMLLTLSENDYTAKEFLEYASSNNEWEKVFKHPTLEKISIKNADHTFSNHVDKKIVEEKTLTWLINYFK